MLTSVIVVTVEVIATKFEAIEEWQLWKAEHGQQYPSSNVSQREREGGGERE